MADTLEMIRADITDLKERLRELRIEQGKPPEAPPNFVPVPLSIVLAERVRSFIPIAIKYASLLAGGTLHRVDTSKFEHYRRDAELLCRSTGLWCSLVGGGVYAIIRVMDDVNAIIDAGEEENAHIPGLLRRFHFALELARHDVQHDMWDGYESEASLTRAEVERLKNDPAAFQAAYDEALAHYEAIKQEV
ncbi:hypothetical protein [Paenibacillus ehimensis]|uniref:Uncharacterized protein n=1 Tax=Paenibacillus ehimensis TaxID=79264 RepID=A0ABT8VL36_9BACL|nr:hypothetical protein [Paenibacillus ehimensis]MDO3681697.1 hypothetical protein [Paenibacillus ehimensis]